jgi:hypothetical protein
VVAVAAALTLLALALWQLPGLFRRTSRTVDSVAHLTAEQRRLIPARQYDMATEIFVAAKQTIPKNKSYAVLTGSGVQVSSPLTLQKAPPFALFYLLPRRQRDISQAEWVISYGGDLGPLHSRIRRIVHVLPGLDLAKLSH